MPTHLRPTAPIAPDVLLPGDPALALALAQELLDKPLMANHSHGLWGYTGSTAQGHELTIQATGIGGPSAAAVLGELAGHGAARAVRLGVAVAFDRRLAPGDTLVVETALAADGASRALGARAPVADPALTRALAALLATAPRTVASFDLWDDPATTAHRQRWCAEGAVAADLESAATLALGARLGLAVGVGLAVAQAADGESDEPSTDAALIELGRAGVAALAASAQPSPLGR